MKAIVVGATIAIIATQIGCTWWLSQQPVRLNKDDWNLIQSATATTVRNECYIKDVRRMLLAMDRHESISDWIETRTNCLWDASARPDLSEGLKQQDLEIQDRLSHPEITPEEAVKSR